MNLSSTILPDPRALPTAADTAKIFADPLVRNLATVGGNLAEIIQVCAALRLQGEIGIALIAARAEQLQIVIDPICGMEVDLATAHHTVEVEEEIVGFCYAGCLHQYQQRLAS